MDRKGGSIWRHRRRCRRDAAKVPFRPWGGQRRQTGPTRPDDPSSRQRGFVNTPKPGARVRAPSPAGIWFPIGSMSRMTKEETESSRMGQGGTPSGNRKAGYSDPSSGVEASCGVPRGTRRLPRLSTSTKRGGGSLTIRPRALARLMCAACRLRLEEDLI